LDIATQVVDAINRKFDQLMVASFASNSAHMHTQHTPCSFCSSPMYHIIDCPTAKNFSDVSHGQVNAAFSRSGNDPYSNTYNPGWRNH
jgi:Zn-finger protein